ncbi:hypothetical protein IV64_GL001708 [Lactiplantibacillus xiangfangensis]|uniref:Phage protein n=1 Tax=Lactiplantibacillus xiangfangensis TaxID=942150 RepID=A0A0R2MPU5_9LACO|nr:hypothetical protein [Lactiplantibacillus xiangfangensis]KRO14224.1 hypothetical protein IV64_GL001708 [Lactiplantibacillus xiangfangensis]
MDMTTETLQHIESQALTAAGKKVYTDESGKQFLIGDDVRPYHRDGHADEAIETSTLSSIVTYIKSGMDNRKHVLIHVVSPTRVDLLGDLDDYGAREELMTAAPTNDAIRWGHFYDRESMNILLQSGFRSTSDGMTTDDRDAIVKFIGNLVQDNNSVHVQDDGVTQSANVRQGVANQAEAKVPNPVLLKPYRTFTEVDQPESHFIFRIDADMEAALFEADGGAWRQVAINNVKDYLSKALADLADVENKVTILG